MRTNSLRFRTSIEMNDTSSSAGWRVNERSGTQLIEKYDNDVKDIPLFPGLPITIYTYFWMFFNSVEMVIQAYQPIHFGDIRRSCSDPSSETTKWVWAQSWQCSSRNILHLWSPVVPQKCCLCYAVIIDEFFQLPLHARYSFVVFVTCFQGFSWALMLTAILTVWYSLLILGDVGFV